MSERSLLELLADMAAVVEGNPGKAIRLAADEIKKLRAHNNHRERPFIILLPLAQKGRQKTGIRRAPNTSLEITTLCRSPWSIHDDTRYKMLTGTLSMMPPRGAAFHSKTTEESISAMTGDTGSPTASCYNARLSDCLIFRDFWCRERDSNTKQSTRLHRMLGKFWGNTVFISSNSTPRIPYADTGIHPPILSVRIPRF